MPVARRSHSYVPGDATRAAAAPAAPVVRMMMERIRTTDAPCGELVECSGALARAILVHSDGCGRPRPLSSALEERTYLAVLRSPDPDRARRRGRAPGRDHRPCP